MIYSQYTSEIWWYYFGQNLLWGIENCRPQVGSLASVVLLPGLFSSCLRFGVPSPLCAVYTQSLVGSKIALLVVIEEEEAAEEGEALCSK